MKKENTVVDYTEDFGFFVISEEELNNSKTAKIENIVNDKVNFYEQKLKKVHKTILPLLNNLKQNAEKEYIYWPNRVEKIDEFIKKIEKIMFED